MGSLLPFVLTVSGLKFSGAVGRRCGILTCQLVAHDLSLLPFSPDPETEPHFRFR